MAAAAAARSVVKAQQEYAATHNLSTIFEKLATAIVYSKPANLLDFIAGEAKKMLDQGDSYSPVPVNRVSESEEAAAKYMELNRVPAVLEELFALILVNKPACPFSFIVSEASTLKALYATHSPVRRIVWILSGNSCFILMLFSSQSNLFTDDDLKGMFTLFDTPSNNYITREQCCTAIKNLGIQDLSEVPEDPGAKIDLPTFVQIARNALNRERLL